MANTTKSTKAKTKTAATRTTKRSSSRTKAASSTKSAAAKKPVAKKEAVKSTVAKSVKPKKVSAAKTNRTAKATKVTKATKAGKLRSFKLAKAVTLRTLRGLHLMTAGLLALLAIATGYFMSNTSYQLTVGHLAKDDLAGVASAALAPAMQAVFDVELRWLVVVILVLSLILPLLYLTKLAGRYAEYLNKTRMLPFRWIDFAVTGALVIETVALVSGVSDLPTLKLIAGLMVVTALTGLIAERQNDATKTPVRSAYLTSLFAGILPILLIVAYIITTFVFGTLELPWYIYALLAVALFQYVGWMRNLRMHLRGANNLIVERNYLAISLLTKAAFAIVLIAGFFR